MLDMFCNQGGFALACALNGAASVTAVDVSEHAIDTGRRNAARSNLDIDWQCENAFNYLKSASSSAEDDGAEGADKHPNMVILDPPSFARNKRTLNDAVRGYKEIHLRALKILRAGGLLVTSSCSHHFGASQLKEVANAAAVDAKRTLRQVATYAQRPDHPVLLGIPETSYLHGFAFEVMPSW